MVLRLRPEMGAVVGGEAVQVLALSVLHRPDLASSVQATQFAHVRHERIVRCKEVDQSGLLHCAQELHPLSKRFASGCLRHHMLARLQRLDCQGRVLIEGVGEDDPLHIVCQEGIIVLVANSTQGVTGTAESKAVKVADRHDVHAHHLALSSQGEPSSDSDHTHP